MKNILFAGAFALAAFGANAGGYDDPIVTPPVVSADVVMDDAVESAGSDEWVGVLMTFLTLIVVGLGS